MVGRPHHNYWERGHFQPLKKENGRVVAVCMICNRELINTARCRLISHRKQCLVKDDVGVNEQSTIKSSPSAFKKDQKHILMDIKCEEERLETHNQQDDAFESDEQNDDEDESESVIQVYFDNASEEFYIDTNTLHKENKALSQANKDTEIKIAEVSSSSTLPNLKRRKMSDINPQCSGTTSKGIYMEKTHVAFCEFLISANLPLKALNSVYLKSFLGKLNKFYKPPSLKALTTTYADKIQEKYKIQLPNEERDAILLLTGWKDLTVTCKHIVACLHLNGQIESEPSRVFLNSWDVDTEITATEDETQMKIIRESIDLAKSQFNANIYAIISDNPHLHVDSFDTRLWNFVCHTHAATCLAENIIEENDAKIVKQALRNLQIDNIEKLILEKQGARIMLPSAKRWCTYRDSFKCFIVNYPIVQDLLKNGHCTLQPLAKKYFFNDDFREKIEKYFEFLLPLCDLIYISQKKRTTLGEIAEEWLQLNFPTEFRSHLEPKRRDALTPFAMAANFFHPAYRGRRLNPDQKLIVEYFLVESLDAKALDQLLLFKRSEGIFKILEAKKMTSFDTYWSIAEQIYPELAGFAKQLLCIPASISQIDKIFSNWSLVHSSTKNLLGIDVYKKLTKLHFALNFQESK